MMVAEIQAPSPLPPSPCTRTCVPRCPREQRGWCVSRVPSMAVFCVRPGQVRRRKAADHRMGGTYRSVIVGRSWSLWPGLGEENGVGEEDVLEAS